MNSNVKVAVLSVLVYLPVMLVFASMDGTETYVREPEEIITGESLMAEVTAYTSDPAETDEDPLITANGDTVGDGTIACPSRFKFGTIIKIQDKLYKCNDRMNKRYRDKNNFDIWMPEKRNAIDWGRKTVEVTVILEVIPRNELTLN